MFRASKEVSSPKCTTLSKMMQISLAFTTFLSLANVYGIFSLFLLSVVSTSYKVTHLYHSSQFSLSNYVTLLSSGHEEINVISILLCTTSHVPASKLKNRKREGANL